MEGPSASSTSKRSVLSIASDSFPPQPRQEGAVKYNYSVSSSKGGLDGVEEGEEEPSILPSVKVSRTAQDLSDQLLEIEERLCQELGRIQFGAPVTHIYNPLSYAVETHQCFVRCYGNSRKRVVFLGMNPGPFGMAQTGVGKSTTEHMVIELYLEVLFRPYMC